MGCRVSICRVLCTPTHSGPDHTHTPAALGVHTPCSWAPQHSDTHRGAPILRPRQSYRHTPSHTDVHISGYTLTYTHTYPCTSSYKLTCHPPELHTHTQLSTRTLSRDAHTHHQIHPKPGLHMQHTGVDTSTCRHSFSYTAPHKIQTYTHTSPQARTPTSTQTRTLTPAGNTLMDGRTDGHAPFAAGAGRCSPRIGRPWERSALYRPGDGEGRDCLICLNAITPLLSSQPSASPRPGRQPPPPTPAAPPGAARGRSPRPAGDGDIGSGHGLRA